MLLCGFSSVLLPVLPGYLSNNHSKWKKSSSRNWHLYRFLFADKLFNGSCTTISSCFIMNYHAVHVKQTCFTQFSVSFLLSSMCRNYYTASEKHKMGRWQCRCDEKSAEKWFLLSFSFHVTQLQLVLVWLREAKATKGKFSNALWATERENNFYIGCLNKYRRSESRPTLS